MNRLGLLLLALVCQGPMAAPASAGEWSRGSGAAPWAPGDPLRVRNLSPVSQLYALPRALGPIAAPNTTELLLTLEHANNFTAKAGGDVAVIFDGATTVTSLALRRGAGDRWEWGVELPLVHHSGGFTDGFIEEFHELFGFPDGGRDNVARNRLDYRVIEGGTMMVEVSDTQTNVGDVRAWLGYRLHRSPGREAGLRAMVGLPTGQVNDLSGSKSADAALWLELADGRWLDAVNTTVTLSAGMTVPGDDDVFPGRERDVVVSGHLGLHYPMTPRITLRAQLDGHSEIIDSPVKPLAAGALLGTLGGSVRLSPTLRLDLALVEDLTPHRAPDAVFTISLGARF